MPRPSTVSSVTTVLLVLALVAASCARPAVAAAAGDDLPVVAYRPPVPGPIVDRFHLPEQRWQAGNRGIDYDPAPGTPVVAAAEGRVAFAGPVAGALHVTVAHPDGLRTSYSFLAEVAVRQGQQVRTGDVVGTAGGPVHFGVRAPDGTYLDPEALLVGTLEPRVRLVPGAEEGLDPLAERRSLLESLVDTGAAAAAFLRDKGSEWAGLAAHYVSELSGVAPTVRALDTARRWWDQRDDCTPAGTRPRPPTGRRIAVLVSGLGTASDGNSAWEIDTDTLGYAATDVVRFSYAGGQAPPAAGEQGSATDVAVHAFDGVDSQQPVEVSADRLAELLRHVAADQPGVPIDVLAHSQGGVVARMGVAEAGADGSLPATVANLVTIGSPHQGAPLATAVEATGESPGGRAALARVRASGLADGLDDRLPAMTSLAETSPTIGRLHDLTVPDQVRFTSIGAVGDLTVPGTATADPQADGHRLVRTGLGPAVHGELASHPATTREVALAVAGMAPTCQGLVDALVSFGGAEVVRGAENLLGAGVAQSAAAPAGAALALAGSDG